MRDTDPVPTPLPGYQSIKVDISSLESFAASLRAELEHNFIPQANRVVRQLGSDIPFTCDERFVETYSAAIHYLSSRDAMVKQMSSYIEATGKLVQSVMAAAQGYRDADATH